MKRTALRHAALAVLLSVVACLAAALPAQAAGITGRVRWGTSACVYQGSKLAAIRLEGVTVSSRLAVRERYVGQWVRVRVTYQAAHRQRWRKVGSRKRLLKVRTSRKLWTSALTFSRIRSAPSYRAVVRATWYDPRTGRAQGTRTSTISCVTHQATPALTCPTGLHWTSPTTLAWDPVPGARGYYVRRHRVDGGDVVAPVTARSASYTFPVVAGLDPNYAASVEPFNGSGTIDCPASIPGRNDRLAANGYADGGDVRLVPGAQLTSPNGRFYLLMQPQGNLVLYEAGVARWWTQDYSGPSAYVVIQGDGNFVQYRMDGQGYEWNAGTNGIGGGAKVLVTDSGDVVVLDSTGRVRWKGNGTDCHAVAGCRYD